MFEERAKQQLKMISSNEIVKYEPVIKECGQLFAETKEIITSIETMWSGVTEIKRISENIKDKTEHATVLQPK